ncbi:hypothetical protein Val02_69750 [Virgisporangium aliadipatigenens]|uniref:Transmembrane protein n=1 Tax=Virgisporangium aliadipatigenens TaxID=741659 RepID=A0A8J3YQS7_9ACTN|nr:hypothetical protein [Virgisporangium aliadipatigenens]GIJ50089.1 hypothetical protein Val02_69750 [Virgisporangium aliadipatigenens]
MLRKVIGTLLFVVLVGFAAGTAWTAVGHLDKAWRLADAAWLGDSGAVEIAACGEPDADVGTRACTGRFRAKEAGGGDPTVRIDLSEDEPHDPGARVPAVVGGLDGDRAYPAGGPGAFTVALQLILAAVIGSVGYACGWLAYRLAREPRIWLRDRWRGRRP